MNKIEAYEDIDGKIHRYHEDAERANTEIARRRALDRIICVPNKRNMTTLSREQAETLLDNREVIEEIFYTFDLEIKGEKINDNK